MCCRRLLIAGVWLATGFCSARAVDPQFMKWTIDHVERDAIVYPPSVQEGRSKAPLIFVFHGHGDNAWFATEQFAFQNLWPEAVVVYPQGLPTPAASDPQGERRGWQHQMGEVGDRDLKLFDAMLRSLRWKFRIDDRRIYAAGFSNGGFFDYILWSPSADDSSPRWLRAPRPCVRRWKFRHPSRCSWSPGNRTSASLSMSSARALARCGRSMDVPAMASLGRRGPHSIRCAGRHSCGGLYSSVRPRGAPGRYGTDCKVLPGTHSAPVVALF